MPEYESANQQAADDAPSISSWSLWSLVSSVFSLASNSVPEGQRYDPVQQQPDDNSSIGSGEQDNHLSNAASDIYLSEARQTSQTDETLRITPAERGIDNNQPIENSSNTGIRTRRLLWWLRDFRVLLLSTTDSRRAKLVNGIILPLISVLYFLTFSSVTADKGVTEGVLSAVCLMLVTYHRVQAIRVFVPLSQSPQFNNLGDGDKFLFWSWIAPHLIYFLVEILLYAEYWIAYMSWYGYAAVFLTVFVVYFTVAVTYSLTSDNQALTEINFPETSIFNELQIPIMPYLCFHVSLMFANGKRYVFHAYLLPVMLWVPLTIR